MIFFKNATIYTTTKETSKNAIGQVLTTYKKDRGISVNVQPITEQSKQKDWGNNIDATYNMYSDITLEVGEIISYNNKSYRINKAIYWNTYNIYALLEADVEVANE